MLFFCTLTSRSKLKYLPDRNEWNLSGSAPKVVHQEACPESKGHPTCECIHVFAGACWHVKVKEEFHPVDRSINKWSYITQDVRLWHHDHLCFCFNLPQSSGFMWAPLHQYELMKSRVYTQLCGEHLVIIYLILTIETWKASSWEFLLAQHCYGTVCSCRPLHPPTQCSQMPTPVEQ